MENNNGGSQNPLKNMIQINIDPDDMIKMARLRGIDVNKKHIQFLKEAIEKIKSDDPKDRLEAAVSLEIVIHAMNVSIDGWKHWCSLRGMNIITDKEFEDLLPKMKKLAIKWLEIDKKITAVKTKEMEEELKEFEIKTTKPKEKKQSKDVYVS